MKVKLLTGMVRVEGERQVSFAPGAVIEVSAAEGERLLAARLAERVKPEPAKRKDG